MSKGKIILALVIGIPTFWGVFIYEDPDVRQKRIAEEHRRAHNAIVLSCQAESVTYQQVAACVALSEGRY